MVVSITADIVVDIMDVATVLPDTSLLLVSLNLLLLLLWLLLLLLFLGYMFACGRARKRKSITICMYKVGC